MSTGHATVRHPPIVATIHQQRLVRKHSAGRRYDPQHVLYLFQAFPLLHHTLDELSRLEEHAVTSSRNLVLKFIADEGLLAKLAKLTQGLM